MIARHTSVTLCTCSLGPRLSSSFSLTASYEKLDESLGQRLVYMHFLSVLSNTHIHSISVMPFFWNPLQVAVPYLIVKMDSLYSRLQEENDITVLSWQRGQDTGILLKLLFFKAYPYLHALWEVRKCRPHSQASIHPSFCCSEFRFQDSS